MSLRSSLRLSAHEHEMITLALRAAVSGLHRITTGNLAHDRNGVLSCVELAQATLSDAEKKMRAARRRLREKGGRAR